ncbi:MAG: winged helix-turn-helix transcriptional regulator [Clostridiales bacterium]|nr:winged helix-turn-helix transcriptional regulator [Clostridiales bacterium]
MDALEKNGSPQPEFETDESRSYFITRLFIHEDFLKKERIQEGRSSDGQDRTGFIVTTDEKKTGQENDRSLTEVLTEVNMKKVAPLVEFIEENGQISPKEAAKLLGKSASTVYRYLSLLTQTGLIVKDGNTNNIVYRPA